MPDSWLLFDGIDDFDFSHLDLTPVFSTFLLQTFHIFTEVVTGGESEFLVGVVKVATAGPHAETSDPEQVHFFFMEVLLKIVGHHHEEVSLSVQG